MSEHLIAQFTAERERRAKFNAELVILRPRLDADPDNAQLREQIGTLSGLARASNDLCSQLQDQIEAPQRRDHLRAVASQTSNREQGTDFGPAHPAGAEASERRDGAFREAQNVLEAHVRSAELPSSSADRLDALLRGPDLHFGLDARYIAAVGQPEYKSAFAKMLMYGASSALRMTSEEQSAVQQVVAADELRSMSVGTGSAGGFGVPLAIDPTMVISSPGTISPIRELASQVTIATREYRAVTTAGTTATFAAELTEVADGSPTLAQPDIFTEKAQAFIPFSIEVSMDYPNLLGELAGLLADAKNVLEGTKFALGAGHGSNEPQGLITGLSGGSIYTTASAGTLALDDIYGVQNSLSPRWQANAQWLTSLSLFNTVKRFVASASATEPQIFSNEGILLLSKPWNEVSDMATAVAASAKVAIYGDIKKAFRIVDRIGLAIELVPHIFGGSGRPTGSRGVYAYWRTSSGILVNDAARVVAIHA